MADTEPLESPVSNRRVLVAGAGTHFLSAMSYYTLRITNALAARFEVAAVPMLRLIPRFLYPGASRVGSVTTTLTYSPEVTVFRGADWYWGPKILSTLRAIWRWRPDVAVFQWWTGTVLHTYLVAALVARMRGAAVVIECHEILDTGEARFPLARVWAMLLGRPFFKLASAVVVHSEVDRDPIRARYRLGSTPCVVIPHGPLDHHASSSPNSGFKYVGAREAPPEATNLLFFGIIRPYKGLEDLVRAFDSLDEEEIAEYWLTVVGETWEGWDLPIKLIENSRYRHRITLVNRFVSDDEVVSNFVDADAVVLPYHRSSASSPAHVTMSNGLPMIITSVGGLPAAVSGYEGAIMVPPHDPDAIRQAIRKMPALKGKRFEDPHTWSRTVDCYEDLFRRLK